MGYSIVNEFYTDLVFMNTKELTSSTAREEANLTIVGCHKTNMTFKSIEILTSKYSNKMVD